MTHRHQTGLNYRMPYGFGPSAGPRQGPDGKGFATDTWGRRVTISTSFLTDPAALEPLLPPRFELAGEPVVTVDLAVLTELSWLAGRGYSILNVRFPACYRGKDETVTGHFLSVLWENKPDPIITGREELGYAKLFCDLPPPRIAGDRVSAIALWEGHQFAELELTDLTEGSKVLPAVPGLPGQKSDGVLHYKYIPDTGAWGTSAVEHACLSPAGAKVEVVRIQRGKGRVRFMPTTWEQIPTQYHVISALAALPQLEPREAFVTEVLGGGDLSDQRKLG